jgi:hypothetical protein
VVHPDRPGDYLVGVECDGATYHSAATARDRDKVRSEILRGLGWKLVRVWSTEWWVDREGALERLHEAISAELTEQRARAAIDVAAKRAREIEAVTASSSESMADVPEDLPAAEPVAKPPQTSTSQLASDAGRTSVSVNCNSYRVTDFADLQASLQPDHFQDTVYDDTIVACINRVLEQEAPILDRLLVERIARAHGFKRSGRLIRERILDLAERCGRFVSDDDPERGQFIWPIGADPAQWNSYRLPERDEDARSIEELPPEEIRAAANEVTGDDPALDIARVFGVRRLSASGRERILRVLG